MQDPATKLTPKQSEVSWDDACFEMVLECEEPDDPEDGFLPPSADLIAKYCRLYPQWADDFIDFAAACRAVDFWAKEYSAPEPTEEELKAWVKRAMERFRVPPWKAKRTKS